MPWEQDRLGPAPAYRAALVAVLVIFGALVVFGVATPALVGASSTPCSVRVDSENIAHDAIQTAIDIYPGGVICIGPGTFAEQLTINSSNTVLRGAGSSRTIIEPDAPLTLNTHDYNQLRGNSTESAAAIILVEGPSRNPATGVSGVTIENLEVNGADGQGTFTNCTYEYFGVDFQASSGTLTKAKVVGLQLSAPIASSCNSGVGVYAYHGETSYGASSHQPDSVTVSHTTIDTYQWTGIICSDVNETCALSWNTIVGSGPTSLLGQSGIAIYSYTLATIEHNTISGDVYTGGPSPHNDWYIGDQAVGVGLFPSATGSNVSYNHLSLNQIGVAYSGGTPRSAVVISHNTVDESNAYGIVAVGAPGAGDSANITYNIIDDKQSLNMNVYGAPGILVDTGFFVVAHNRVEGSLATAGASNNASQQVCGPTDPIYCSSNMSLTTAAIQAASESGSAPTYLTLIENSYPARTDTYKLATLSVGGGYVDVVES